MVSACLSVWSKFLRNITEPASPAGTRLDKLPGGSSPKVSTRDVADVEAMFHQVTVRKEDSGFFGGIMGITIRSSQNTKCWSISLALPLCQVLQLLQKCATDFEEENGQEAA